MRFFDFMANLLTYSELSDICNEKKISLSSLAEKAGMTLRGFREGYNRQTIGVLVAASICETLGMTPNELFGWNDERPTFQQVQNGGKNNRQNMTADVELLREQLVVKDKQIQQLLNLLNKK